MKGTYINTVIMMAALSGKNNKRQKRKANETATLAGYRIVWSKDKTSVGTLGLPTA